MLNLDTHILIRSLADDLTPAERKMLAGDRWSISAIVLWEVAKLAQLKRIEVDLDDPDFAAAIGAIHVWPITLDICRAISRLDFRSDPADEIIAATSVVHCVPLVTRDKRIRGSRMVPLA